MSNIDRINNLEIAHEVFKVEAVTLKLQELTSSVSEVRNYVTAAEAACELIAEGQPITIRMLEDLQQELLRGTASDGTYAGSARTTQGSSGWGIVGSRQALEVTARIDKLLALRTAGRYDRIFQCDAVLAVLEYGP